jgi:hypothetical protein
VGPHLLLSGDLSLNYMRIIILNIPLITIWLYKYSSSWLNLLQKPCGKNVRSMIGHAAKNSFKPNEKIRRKWYSILWLLPLFNSIWNRSIEYRGQ